MAFVGAKRWQITLGSHEPFMAVGSGIGWELAYVLKHPHSELHVLQVQHALAIPTAAGEGAKTRTAGVNGFSVHSGTHLIQRTKLKPEKYREARELLEAELKAAREANDQLLVEATKEGLERLEEYQAEAQHPERDWAKLCNDRMSKGFARFKRAVEKDRTPGGRAFLEHLNEHLTLSSYKFRYHPPEGFDWED